MFTIYISLAVFAGLIAHWAVLWARNKTANTLKEYFSEEFKHTIMTISGALAAAAAIIVTNPDMQITQTLLALGFTAGFTVDSSFNKASDQR